MFDNTMDEASPEEIKQVVRSRYQAIARGESTGCGSASCGDGEGNASANMIGDAYDNVEGYAAKADFKLGCGVPTDHAGLQEGQTVVDLGSGAGLDAFIARQFVGEEGRVIGIDFAEEMIEKARTNANDLGFKNVQFVPGDIENLPLDNEIADVVLSNCVLNLVPDKQSAFSEMYRILKPGGHFCVSDIVSNGELPASIRRSVELYVGCVAGSLPEAAYLDQIREAGFHQVEVPDRRDISLPEEAVSGERPSGEEAADSADELLRSITVRGTKPES